MELLQLGIKDTLWVVLRYLSLSRTETYALRRGVSYLPLQ